MKSVKNRVAVGRNVTLDGRLALFHRRQKWLAVADLHFGYELSQRAAGNLFPMWGMQSIEARLIELLGEYKPRRLVVVGDIVHDRTATKSVGAFLRRLREVTELVLVTGNHDRQLPADLDLVPDWRTKGFCFHHGHCEVDAGDQIQIIGHHHPAGVVRDGAGLRLKLPALVQQDQCWIMPAFSPWAAGTEWRGSDTSRMWLCSPTRILRVDPAETA